MLAEIEEKVMERIKEKIIEPARVEVEKAGGAAAKALSLPSIAVVCGEPMTFEKTSQKHYQLNVSVLVVVVFQNMRNTQELRRGLYSILEALVACLQRQKLGLAIDPLRPKRIDDVTTKEQDDGKQIAMQIEFETGFIIEKLEEDAIDDLIRIGLNYYLQPEHPTSGDVVDATDIVELTAANSE